MESNPRDHVRAPSADAPPEDAGDIVLSIVRRVLGCDTCRADEDFFELGGTSIAAIQIVSLVEQELHVEVSLADFLDAPDLGSLAELVRTRASPIARS